MRFAFQEPAKTVVQTVQFVILKVKKPEMQENPPFTVFGMNLEDYDDRTQRINTQNKHFKNHDRG